jgi:lipoate-protein ligase A
LVAPSSPPSSPSSQPLFDVERFRPEPERVAVIRHVAHPTLVLGSTQPSDVVSPVALREGSVEVVRRRGGGGAVFLEPGGSVWIDAWIPRDDVLWSHDVAAAAEWVGRWWIEALRGVGNQVDGGAGAGFGSPGDLSVHTGRSEPGAWGDLVCFAGRGPGEVFLEDRKIVGLSQWRSREGALFSSCAYAEWDAEPLLDLLLIDDSTRSELAAGLRDVAVGVATLAPPSSVASVTALAQVRDRLVDAFPGIGAAGGA